jgi:hypothetical protein
VIPIRGPVATSTPRQSADGACTSNGGPDSERPFSSSPIPSATVSLPGPEQSSRGSLRPRLRRMLSTPRVGSSARTRTAAAAPSGSQTAFSMLWMP